MKPPETQPSTPRPRGANGQFLKAGLQPGLGVPPTAEPGQVPTPEASAAAIGAELESRGAMGAVQGVDTRPVLRVSSLFGPRVHPITGQQGFHSGVDLAIPEGTPLTAPLAGVVQAWQDEANGNGIAVTGKVGEAVVRVGYAHLAGYGPLAQGQPVQAGQLLGYSGQTGIAKGPHVHIRITWNGQDIDPLRVLDLRAFRLQLPAAAR